MTDRFQPRKGWSHPATPCDLVPIWAGEFATFAHWVNSASRVLTGCYHNLGQEVPAICVDALGRRCIIGADFMRARDDDAFPVRYFWECQPAPQPRVWYWLKYDPEYTYSDIADAADDCRAGEVIQLGVGQEAPDVWAATVPKGDPEDGDFDVIGFPSEAAANAAIAAALAAQQADPS